MTPALKTRGDVPKSHVSGRVESGGVRNPTERVRSGQNLIKISWVASGQI